MKNSIKIIIGLALVGAVVAYQLLTPKGEINVAKAITAHELNAGALYAAFSSDETAANAEYAGTVIEVKGILKAVEKNETNQLQLSLDAEDDLGAVVCTLTQAPADLSNLEIGSSVTVKGICTGYLFDVVIDQAVLL